MLTALKDRIYRFGNENQMFLVVTADMGDFLFIKIILPTICLYLAYILGLCLIYGSYSPITFVTICTDQPVDWI